MLSVLVLAFEKILSISIHLIFSLLQMVKTSEFEK